MHKSLKLQQKVETNGHFQAELHCYLPYYINREKEIGKDTEREREREREGGPAQSMAD